MVFFTIYVKEAKIGIWEADLVLRTEFVSYFFVLGRVLGHFCNVFLYTSFVLKQNIAEMS